MSKPNPSHEPVTVFFSYAHKDRRYRDEIARCLDLLEREGVIKGWFDRHIIPGSDWKAEIDDHLNSARIILLLLSRDFLASEYCYGKEAQTALKRHKKGEACVIPIVVRPCEEWKNTPLKNLQALPQDGKAISLWRPQDIAYQSISRGLRAAISDLRTGITPTFSSHETRKPRLFASRQKTKSKVGAKRGFQAYPFEWIDHRRQEALAKRWIGKVVPLVPLPNVPPEILVTFKFKASWKVIEGCFFFESFKPGIKAVIINQFEGGFYDDHILRLDYVHSDTTRFGFGVLLLSLSGDSSSMNGFILGLSSNYDRLFTSKVSLRPESE